MNSGIAKTSRPPDREMLSEKINNEMGGFSLVDGKVSACFRCWLVNLVLKIDQEEPSEEMESQDKGNFLVLAARFLESEGKNEEALYMWRECLRVRQRGSKNDKSEAVLIAQSNLANAYHNLGMHNMAADLRKEIVMVLEATLGMKDSSTLKAKENLAISYDNLRQYREALTLKKQVLVSRQHALGKEHSDVLRLKTNIAFSLSRLGCHDEAFKLNWELYEIRLRQKGANDSDTLLAASNLANSLVNLGQYAKAVTWYKVAYTGYTNIYEDGHEYALDSLEGLILTLIKLAKFAEAKRFAQKGSASASNRFPVDDSRVLKFNDTINWCTQTLNDGAKVAELKRLSILETAAKPPGSVTVTAILSHLNKVQGFRPERRVNIPVGGMELTRFLKLCVPNTDGHIQYLWVEKK